MVDNLVPRGGFAPFTLVVVRGVAADFAFSRVILLFDPN
jgi:hypothetical protein